MKCEVGATVDQSSVVACAQGNLFPSRGRLVYCMNRPFYSDWTSSGIKDVSCVSSSATAIRPIKKMSVACTSCFDIKHLDSLSKQ